VFPEARWGNSDPTRRQLAGRAQRAGVTVRSYIEVEYATAALELAARGLADTVPMPTILDTMAPGHGLGSVALDPPMHDTYAFTPAKTRAYRPPAAPSSPSASSTSPALNA
jgi:hypothetical protein